MVISISDPFFVKSDRLLVFTDNGVPTWEVYKRIEGSRDRDLITRGTADTFEAAQAAALFEVVAARPSE
jgi:hypothetical protein